AREGLTFVLAHALYLKAIHGGKNKNDRIDSEKLAHLLRSNLIPPSYVYPGTKRPVRALLRQRLYYVWRRAELLARIQCHQLAEGHAPRSEERRVGKSVDRGGGGIVEKKKVKRGVGGEYSDKRG